VALHVHHGLQAQADDWDRFCAALCGDLQVPWSARVTVQAATGEGIEAAARRARHEALGRMCREQGARLLLFAHHRDDQVETVLLRLFRGTGVAGMAGMPARRPLDDRGDIQLVRPWLGVTRAEIDDYCARQGLRWIDDPSNADTRFARAARAIACTTTGVSGLYENVAQAATHFAQAAGMLDALAAQSLASLVCAGRDADTISELDLAGLRALPSEHADAVLRHWLRDLGTQPPSTRAWPRCGPNSSSIKVASRPSRTMAWCCDVSVTGCWPAQPCPLECRRRLYSSGAANRASWCRHGVANCTSSVMTPLVCPSLCCACR
jgi:tRNA(Ile)-lysidine synthase